MDPHVLRKKDFDIIPLVFAQGLTRAFKCNICLLDKQGLRKEWHSCVDSYCQSSGILQCNRTTIAQQATTLNRLRKGSGLRSHAYPVTHPKNEVN